MPRPLRSVNSSLLPVVVGFLILPLLACSAVPPSEPAGKVEALAAPAMKWEEISEATYRGVYDNAITLHEGLYEGEPFEPDGASRPTVTLVKELWLHGDLGEEVGKIAVVLLSENSGGSGSFLFVAVVGRRDGQSVNLATAFISDRPQIRGMSLKQNVITLDLVQAGPDDAACCPTQLVKRRWVLDGNKLIERDVEITGTLHLAFLEARRWQLEAWEMGGKLLSPEYAPTITFANGHVSGFDGCHRYSGLITEQAAGEIHLSPLTTTKKACAGEAGEAQTRFLHRLARVQRYRFWMGNLALLWHDEGGSGFLLFKAEDSD